MAASKRSRACLLWLVIGAVVVVMGFCYVSERIVSVDPVPRCPPVRVDPAMPRYVSNAKLRQFQHDATREALALPAGSDERYFLLQEARDWERRANNNPDGMCLDDIFDD
ncbi:MAG: hypothetical protein OXG46_07505 [Chloroflexi bacterium]|nr:hypothetical protein [Chloroflexota bacterium]MCY3938323.1 hypothetical protein [Chloroflexota bacterium]